MRSACRTLSIIVVLLGQKGLGFANENPHILLMLADEGGVRVPFMVRWDGHFRPGRDVDVVSAYIDLMPTLAAIAGAKYPAAQVEGRSLLPLLDEKSSADWGNRYLFTHKGRWRPWLAPPRLLRSLG